MGVYCIVMVDALLIVVFLSTCANGAVLYVGGSLVLDQLRDIRTQVTALTAPSSPIRGLELEIREKSSSDSLGTSDGNSTEPEAGINDPDPDRISDDILFPSFPGTCNADADDKPSVPLVPHVIDNYSDTKSVSSSGEIDAKAYRGLGTWLWSNQHSTSAARDKKDLGDPEPNGTSQ